MDSLEKPVQTRIGCGVEVQGQLCCIRSLRTLTSKDPSQTMHEYLKKHKKGDRNPTAKNKIIP
ncbi:hypothetical protein DPMN_132262 [Dreissena polymorpha]|uniref:Uncharacterized protein n=1 Tax=Dreissena polymorpha TaxID=45954 RepID=A0A9D4J9X9_DREPO|nr:hypothetical protein DPMN_132262 [Dreissena polymorpha]